MMKSARMHEYEVKIQCEKIAGNKLITSSYFKRIEYFLGNGRELLPSILVMVVCHDSRVFRTRGSLLSITLAFLKVNCFFFLMMELKSKYLSVWDGFL